MDDRPAADGRAGCPRCPPNRPTHRRPETATDIGQAIVVAATWRSVTGSMRTRRPSHRSDRTAPKRYHGSDSVSQIEPSSPTARSETGRSTGSIERTLFVAGSIRTTSGRSVEPDPHAVRPDPDDRSTIRLRLQGRQRDRRLDTPGVLLEPDDAVGPRVTVVPAAGHDPDRPEADRDPGRAPDRDPARRLPARRVDPPQLAAAGRRVCDVARPGRDARDEDRVAVDGEAPRAGPSVWRSTRRG